LTTFNVKMSAEDPKAADVTGISSSLSEEVKMSIRAISSEITIFEIKTPVASSSSSTSSAVSSHSGPITSIGNSVTVTPSSVPVSRLGTSTSGVTLNRRDGLNLTSNVNNSSNLNVQLQQLRHLSTLAQANVPVTAKPSPEFGSALITAVSSSTGNSNKSGLQIRQYTNTAATVTKFIELGHHHQESESRLDPMMMLETTLSEEESEEAHEKRNLSNVRSDPHHLKQPGNLTVLRRLQPPAFHSSAQSQSRAQRFPRKPALVPIPVFGEEGVHTSCDSGNLKSSALPSGTKLAKPELRSQTISNLVDTNSSSSSNTRRESLRQRKKESVSVASVNVSNVGSTTTASSSGSSSSNSNDSNKTSGTTMYRTRTVVKAQNRK